VPQGIDLAALSEVHVDVVSGAESSNFGANAVATFATVGKTSELPPRLVVAAVRVCRDIYRDDEVAVAAMLNVLVGYGPTAWAWLIPYFEQQLPTATAPEHFERLITCSGCRYAEYPVHPAIARCGAGVESGLVSGGYWATDRHVCSSYQDSQR
jgi:hypothetical protein